MHFLNYSHSSCRIPLPSWAVTPSLLLSSCTPSHPGIYLQGPVCSHLVQSGESQSSPPELWAAETLPHVSACLSMDCSYPETEPSKHTKGFLGIREVILSSSAVIIASSLGVQNSCQRWGERDGGYGKAKKRETVFYEQILEDFIFACPEWDS